MESKLRLYFFVVIVLLLCNTILLSTINNREIIEDYMYMQDKAINQTKMMSCLSLIHNSISEGNEDLSKELSKIKDDLAKYYDKYILVMLNKCYHTITQEQINAILSPEKIYGKLTIEEKNLIQISPQMISDFNLTSDEKELYDSIEEALKVNYPKQKFVALSFFSKNLKTISIASCVVILVLILLTIRSIFYDKKILAKYKED